MDEWLTALKADTSDRSIERKVRRAKPADAFDFCLLSNDPTQTNPKPTEWNKVTDPAVCDADPFLGRHRRRARSRAEPTLGKHPEVPAEAAQLGRLCAAAVLRRTQWARLNAVFPDGVCDWNKPGVEQERARSPRDYSDGPGGERLGSAPDSDGHGHHRGHDRDDDD